MAPRPTRWHCGGRPVDPSFGEFVSGALRLDRATFDLVGHSPFGLHVALTVLLLAGASETLGQAVVLVLNRVSKRRFVLALVLGGLELVFEALVWIATVWLVARLFGGDRASFATAVRVLGLAFAPLLFGVLVFLPYIGPVLAQLLRVWVLLAAVTGTSVVFGLVPVVAAVAAMTGFLARWLLLRLFGQLGNTANRWLRRTSTGHTAPEQSTDALLSLGSPEHRG
jgi:hypothetical protein